MKTGSGKEGEQPEPKEKGVRLPQFRRQREGGTSSGQVRPAQPGGEAPNENRLIRKPSQASGSSFGNRLFGLGRRGGYGDSVKEGKTGQVASSGGGVEGAKRSSENGQAHATTSPPRGVSPEFSASESPAPKTRQEEQERRLAAEVQGFAYEQDAARLDREKTKNARRSAESASAPKAEKRAATAQAMEENLNAITSNNTIKARGLSRNPEKRLGQTPEVSQEAIQGLVSAACDPAIPVQLGQSGWRAARVRLASRKSEAGGKAGAPDEALDLTVYTYPDSVTAETPRSPYTNQPQRDKTHFVETNTAGSSGTLSLHVLQDQPRGEILRNPRYGIRNPGTYRYDDDVLEGIGFRGTTRQALVRAEVGISRPGSQHNTRYVVYETCNTPNGKSRYIIGRADTQFKPGREERIDGLETRGTSHIPSETEVRLLTDTLRMYTDLRKG